MEKTTSTTSTIIGEEGAEASHPPSSQNELCVSFMEVGSKLFSACPDLFTNALTQLSNQFSLALVKNPDVLRSTTSSAEKTSCSKCSSDKTDSRKSKGKKTTPATTVSATAKHTPFRKYVLPKDAPPEYYQCMDCGEQRPENSFLNDHTHFGKKPQIRWYCPLCKMFFAVTHRSGHIKCKHPSSETSSPASSPRSSPLCASPDSCKRCESVSSSPVYSPNEGVVLPTATSATLVREEEDEEEQIEVPAQKRVCVSSAKNDEEANRLTSCLNEIRDNGENGESSAYDDNGENYVVDPIVRVPSTPYFFGSTTTMASSSTDSEDILPAFRCPSYVTMPTGTDSSTSTNTTTDFSSGFVLFM